MRKRIKGQPLQFKEISVISLDEFYNRVHIYTKEDAMRNLIDSASKAYKDYRKNKDKL